MMRTFVGILFIVAALVLAVYVGVWWAFVGGIIGLVHAFQHDPVQASAVAWNIVKIVGCETFAGLAAFIPGVIGWTLLGARRW